MDLDDQAVRPGYDGRPGQGLDVLPVTGGVTGIDDDREMGKLLEDRHGADVQGVAGGRLEGADPPFAEDDVVVARGKDVFCRHEEFLDGAHHSPLQEDGFSRLSHLLQEGEVLDVSRPDLEDVGILFHQIHVGGVHHFRHDGETRLLPGLLEDLEALLFHALEAVRRRAGFVGPAPEYLGAPFPGDVGAFEKLRLAFDGAGSGHNNEIRPADLQIAHPDDRVAVPGLAAGQLVGLEDGHDLFHPRQVLRGLQLRLAPVVAHDADDRPLHPLGGVGLVAHRLDPTDDVVHLLFRGVFLHDYNHFLDLQKERPWEPPPPHGLSETKKPRGNCRSAHGSFFIFSGGYPSLSDRQTGAP